ncbi:MAG: hypothetical protein M3Q07_00870 [Pseudobdellovibrionaceae bacterium]|nr:hypothetical protein [Pseudobdellovibrionaceae bacterium]
MDLIVDSTVESGSSVSIDALKVEVDQDTPDPEFDQNVTDLEAAKSEVRSSRERLKSSVEKRESFRHCIRISNLMREKVDHLWEEIFEMDREMREIQASLSQDLDSQQLQKM